MDDTTLNELTMNCEFLLDRTGDGMVEEFEPFAGEEMLFPANGNKASFQVTLRYGDGRPAPGRRVTCRSEPASLIAAQWRDVNHLAPRFERSEALIRDRVAQAMVRLGARVTPTVATTDRSGVATFTVEAFHVCGNDAAAAADHIIANSEAGESRALIKCGVAGLAALSDSPGSGLTTSGLVGRHMHPDVIRVLQAIGAAWQQVGGKPAGMPNHITVTGATMRWGGLNPPHLTHRFGGTADLRPIGTRDAPVSVSDPHYHRRGTEILVDFLRQTGATAIYFAENLPGVTKVDAGHRDHIHASWLRNPLEPWLTRLSAESLRRILALDLVMLEKVS
ncbi:hypothetical protein [Thalassobaculum sp.]|uniref:hypothetical protein n=1 Tax=Thalassobaculum sp. TaxID=2022740 RepID=UPI0032EDA058